jgi:transcriptional regulator with XRE-family HTH domain
MAENETRTEKGAVPGVAVDGAKARAVREQKKLTQLYVASVVGVTTDTISRWENNRYPTIKRENAEKLAEALEVSLDEIIRVEEPAPEPTVEKSRSRGPIAITLLLIIFVLAGAGVYVWREVHFPPKAERLLPRFAAPSEIIPVRIRILRESGSRGFIVKERIPEGWRLVKALPPPSGEGSGEVKWLIPGGTGPVTISYAVQVSPASAVKAQFDGRVGVHSDGVTRGGEIEGDRTVTVDGHHWADTNADGRIDDNEIMPAYYLTDELKDLGLDWKTIEAIWSARGYRWDRDRKVFEVIK